MAQNKPEIAVDKSAKFRACERILSRHPTILARDRRLAEYQCGDHFNIDFALARLCKCGTKAAPIKFSRELLRRFRACAVKFKLAARMLFD